MMVAEADVILKLAQAKNLGDEASLKELKIIADDLKDRRKSMVEAAKVEVAKEQASAKKAEGNSKSGSNN